MLLFGAIGFGSRYSIVLMFGDIGLVDIGDFVAGKVKFGELSQQSVAVLSSEARQRPASSTAFAYRLD